MKTEIDNSISLGSTADIAFLLLIFFLVVTTISVDKGLLRKLPEISESQKAPVIHERDLMVILINANDEIMVEGTKRNLAEIKDLTIKYLTNPTNNEKLPDKEPKIFPHVGEIYVSKAIISLQNDRSTSYGKYIEVMNEIIAAGNAVKNDFSLSHFGKPYEQLDKQNKEIVKKAIPVMISEAEPVEIMKD